MNTDKLNINITDINTEDTSLDNAPVNEVDFSGIEFEEQRISDAEINKIHIQEPTITEADFEDTGHIEEDTDDIDDIDDMDYIDFENFDDNEHLAEARTDDIFDKDFEVIYEGELPPIENDFGNDAYKDVLSSLSQLDPTDGMTVDYLAENRTRTFRFAEDADKLMRYKKNSSDAGSSDKAKEKKERKVPRLLRPFFGNRQKGGKVTIKK